MEPLPPGHRLRPAGPQDRAEVAALMAAAEVAEYGVAETDEDDVAAAWSRPRFDLARDAWVVEGPYGALHGYSDVWDSEPHVDFDVDPWILPGAPHLLLQHLIAAADQRAREHLPLAPRGSRPVLHTIVAGVDVGGHALLERLGWRQVRTFLRMSIDLPEQVAEPAWPHGLTARPFRPGQDDAIAMAVVQEAFAGQFRYPATTLEQFRHQRLGERFAPHLSFLVRDGDGDAGALLARVEDAGGWIQEVAVLAPYRGRGLGFAMLTHAFALCRAHGLGHVDLGVDAENASGATRLYERAGMRRTRHYDFFNRPLTG